MQFITEITKQSEKHEGTLMTMAQVLRQEGKFEGIQEGIQIGEKKGEKQASMKIARQMLKVA
ncbi:hypothetical protein [Candidatus Williamhamiltonella defendens]|uniref:Transposase n=3 Tax=Candidatus Williamhamiltonella defendens TaxID=138072 RepID=C4K617_HAMD5|nr:hypothetical protein [Candidatus Hamiltonella defensa]ACQ68010.1 hypothetical protein HDEF_1373 [Candidatus Hamiltonella defensa 5AT (Acyrthosiphon pisum)]